MNVRQVEKRLPPCPTCGGPMVVTVHGGEEPDPDRPGKWRPATTVSAQCEKAAAERRLALDRAKARVEDRFARHTRSIRFTEEGEPA